MSISNNCKKLQRLVHRYLIFVPYIYMFADNWKLWNLLCLVIFHLNTTCEFNVGEVHRLGPFFEAVEHGHLLTFPVYPQISRSSGVQWKSPSCSTSPNGAMIPAWRSTSKISYVWESAGQDSCNNTGFIDRWGGPGGWGPAELLFICSTAQTQQLLNLAFLQLVSGSATPLNCTYPPGSSTSLAWRPRMPSTAGREPLGRWSCLVSRIGFIIFIFKNF